jgi:hypothetical protein
MSCPSSGNPNKSPLRSRKSSLSAVIDKLRSQHNPESDIFQNSGKKLILHVLIVNLVWLKMILFKRNSGPKYTGDPAMRMEQSEVREKNLDY